MLLIILFCGCFGDVEEIIDCSEKPLGKERDQCYYNQSVEGLDLSSCDEIKDLDLKAKCIDEISVTLLDFYPCKMHDKRSNRDKCEDKVGEARKAQRNA